MQNNLIEISEKFSLGYFNRFIKKHKTLGAQLQQFIDDVIRVYPGRPELGVEGLTLNEINLPTPESENIENLMPISRIPKRRVQEPLSETEDEIQDMDDPEGGLVTSNYFNYFSDGFVTFHFKK